MAVRARSVAAEAAPTLLDWPWHDLSWRGVSARALASGARRLEAETHLSAGRDLRDEFVRADGWQELGAMARAWQPSRLKGITVSKATGTAFLAATQVFDFRPVPRKWLALERTGDASHRFLDAGRIVVTRSGSVGRATLTYGAHSGVLISDDLLRVEAHDPSRWGWLYAYLRSSQARAMMTGEKYGHMIKHLEPEHMHKLPVPDVTDEQAAEFQVDALKVLDLREQAHLLLIAAEDRFAEEVGPVQDLDFGEQGFTIRASGLWGSRRRLDAARHVRAVRTLLEHLAAGRDTSRIADAGLKVWVPGRYKRTPAVEGVVYLDSAEILEVNPDESKVFADCDFGDEHRGRVEPGWLLMPCSGQVYGIIGMPLIAGDGLRGKAISNHVLRIAPTKDAELRIGYLCVALGHPQFGRPLVKALAFGSSVPELDPLELACLPIVRLGPDAETEIAEFAEKAAALRGEADVLERKMSKKAGKVVSRFLERATVRQSAEDAGDLAIARKRLAAIDAHPETVLRGEALEAKMKQWES